MVSLFIPVSLILGAAVWVNSEKKGAARRLMFSMAPSITMFFAIGLFFVLNPSMGNEVLSSFKAAYSPLFSELLGLSLDMTDVIFSVMVELTLSLALCFVLINFAVVVFLYEAASNRYNEEFDRKVSLFHLPENLVFAFLACWALVLVKRFVSFPLPFSLIVNNACFVITAFYAFQGFAIAYFNIRKRKATLRATRFFGVLFLFTLLLPGVNIIICLALPLLGVAENWIRLRKREEGVFKNENYS